LYPPYGITVFKCMAVRAAVCSSAVGRWQCGSSAQQCGSLWQCVWQHAAVRQCAAKLAVWQCTAVLAAVCGSVRVRARQRAAVRQCAAKLAVWQCTAVLAAVCGSVRVRARQCAAVQQCARQGASVWRAFRAAVCGSVRCSVW
jgi:hypothetical protein